MDDQSATSSENRARSTKRKKQPSVRLVPSTQAAIGVQQMARAENDDLNLHVSLCEQRYKELERRLETLDERIAKVEDQVSSIKREMAAGFNDIRLLIEKQNNSRTVQMIATFGSIAVAIIGAIGYILTRH